MLNLNTSQVYVVGFSVPCIKYLFNPFDATYEISRSESLTFLFCMYLVLEKLNQRRASRLACQQ